MRALHDSIDKLLTEADHLGRVTDTDEEWSDDRVELALSVAKRVRRNCTIVVKHIALLRDNQLQP